MGAPCLPERCPGSGTLPPQAARHSGKQPGPAARFPVGRGMWAWKPVTKPTAHAPASWLCGLGWASQGRPRGESVPQ